MIRWVSIIALCGITTGGFALLLKFALAGAPFWQQLITASLAAAALLMLDRLLPRDWRRG